MKKPDRFNEVNSKIKQYSGDNELRALLLEMANSDKREIKSRLRILLAHLLKWDYQPKKRSNSWRSSILHSSMEISLIIEESPSLKSFLRTSIADVYPKAVTFASSETGKPKTAFPKQIPWDIELIMSTDKLEQYLNSN
jgi:hypothetical protein